MKNSDQTEVEELIAAHVIALKVILTTLCQHDKALTEKIRESLQDAVTHLPDSPAKRSLDGLVEHLKQGC